MKSTCLAITVSLAALSVGRICAGPMGTAFTYQGRLNDGGAPANGLYDLGFVLHDDPNNPSYLGNSIVLSGVPITNGLFTVQLNTAGEFGANAFNGQARWLEIDVRTNGGGLGNNFTILAPRQPLSPAPSALFASNAVNAVQAQTALTANTASTATTAGSVAWANITGMPAGFADGVDNDTTYSAGPGLTLSGPTNQFSVNFAGSGGATTAARSDHGHFGATWGGNSDFTRGLSVTNGSANSAVGLFGQQGAGSGYPYIFGNTAGVWGESSQGSGVWGATGYGSGSGVTGLAAATNGANNGVYGISRSVTGTGVYGHATATSGDNAGLCGQSDSTNGVGVFARGSGTSGTALKISDGAIRVAGAGANTSTPAFIHVANLNNSIQDSFSTNYVATVIDNPACNNDPNAILLVTPNWGNPASYTFSAPVVVQYDNGQGGWATNRWVLFPPSFTDWIYLGHRWNVLIIKP